MQGTAYSALSGEQGCVTFQVRLPPSARLQLDDVLVELETLLQSSIHAEKVEKLQDCLLVDIAQDTADRLLKVRRRRTRRRQPAVMTAKLDVRDCRCGSRPTRLRSAARLP